MLTNPTRRDYFSVTIFYLAPSFFWAAMLLVVLQKRIEAFVPAAALPRSMDLIVNAGGIVSILTQVIIGAISDRHRGQYGRRRPFMVAGVLLSVPAIWLFALAGNWPMLVVSFMLLQLFVNVAHGPYQALIPDMIPPERHGMASGYMGLWQLVGQVGSLALAAVLFSGVLGPHGMAYLFAAFTALFVGLMLVTVLGVREAPYTGPELRKRDAMLAILRTDLKGNPSFCWVLVSRFLINLGFYTALLYLKWYLEFALRVPKARVDALTLVMALVVTVTGLAGTMPAGRLADRISKKRIIYGTCGLCVVAAALFWAATGLPLAMAAAAVFGLGLGAFAAVDWALACNVLPEGDAAKFLGIWTISFVLPQMAAAFVGHLTVAAFIGPLGPAGAYRAVFASIVPFMALGILAVSRVREREVTSRR